MNYTITQIADKLKAEREAQGLSQRALSKLAGVPQGHISKIENGTVDLRLSSLIELARALNLELALVPRKTLPAVNSIVRSSDRSAAKSPGNDPLTSRELKRIQSTITTLSRTHPSIKELAQIQRQLNDIQHFRVPKSALETIQQASQALQAINFETGQFDAIRKILSEFQSARNALAHASSELPALETMRSAYSLGDDDHG